MATSNVYMVTGVTSGIGRALALELAKTGATVVIVARDEERGVQVQRQISSATQNAEIDLQLCDLATLSAVRNLATIVSNRYEKLDVLINNASVYKRQRELTVDGYECMFATNHLGPFLLTNMLLDQLLASPSARIVNVTAPATNPLDFEDLHGEREFHSLNAFGATKMANLLFTFELARRLKDTSVRVNAVHPGLARSGLMKEASAPVRFLSWLFSAPPERAAQEVIRVATAPEFQDAHGKFLHRGKEIEAPAYAHDRNAQQRLWEVSAQLSDLSLARGELPINDPHLSDSHSHGS